MSEDAAVCRHFKRGFCSYGTSCRFAHVAPAENAPRRRRGQPRHNLGKVVHFRRWLLEHFGRERLSSGSGVIDVAGGRGALAFELVNCHGIATTVIDPRASLSLDRLVDKWERGRYHCAADTPATASTVISCPAARLVSKMAASCAMRKGSRSQLRPRD